MGKKFFVCKTCGNMVGVIKSSGVPMMCCGAPMAEIVANTEDAAVEKHVPAVKVSGNTVDVVIGDVEHPMVAEHYIEWVYVQTNKGGMRKALSPSDKPAAQFVMAEGEKAEAVYAYCNLHGLWKKDL